MSPIASAESAVRSPQGRSIVESLDGTIPRRRTSILYSLGLLIVAAAMILLPLIYLQQQHSNSEEQFPLSRSVLRDLTEMQYGRHQDIFSALEAADYPFEHAAGKVTLGRFALPHRPTPQQAALVAQAADTMLDNVRTFYFRAMARLASIAEEVEKVLGLPAIEPPPLPAPPDAAEPPEGTF